MALRWRKRKDEDASVINDEVVEDTTVEDVEESTEAADEVEPEPPASESDVKIDETSSAEAVPEHDDEGLDVQPDETQSEAPQAADVTDSRDSEDAVESQDVEPENVQPEAEVQETEVIEPDAEDLGAEVAEPDVTEAESVADDAEVLEAEVAEPDVTEAESVAEDAELLEAEVAEPDVTEAESVADDTEDLEAEVAEPEAPEPDVTEAESVADDAEDLEAEVAEPEVAEPDGAEVDQPDDVEHPAETPEVETPTAGDAEGQEQAEAGSAAYSEEGQDPARGPVSGMAAWARLLRMARPRATKANVLGAVLSIALGAAIATQVQLTNERGLGELSQPELVRLLDNVTLRSSRLDTQIRELESTRDRLKSGTGTTAEALRQAQRRADTLGILAGTVGAQGPGITITISDPEAAVPGITVLDLIQELRDAGAESIDVGGVRVVASSFVGDSGGELSVDGQPVARPIIVKAIGEPKTLSSAMSIPGGIVQTIRQKGANATVQESGLVSITSLHTATDPTHARPSS